MLRLLTAFFIIIFTLFPQENANQEETKPSLDGFGEIAWETSYGEVLERFNTLIQNATPEEQIEIVNEREEEALLVKRNDVLYMYRFYKTPQLVLDLDPQRATAEIDPETQQVNYKSVGTLYGVSSMFNYVPTAEVQNKLEQKYGKPQKRIFEDEGKTSGAIVWDLSTIEEEEPKGGIIILWVENYKNSNFTRKIDYTSTKLKQKIETEYDLFFTAEESKIIDKLVP